MSAASTCQPAPRPLALWDLDHTLIETHGVGRAIYERAFPAAAGKPLTTLATISGRTKLGIMVESLRRNNIEPTDARHELRTVGRALPGVQDTLASLAHNPIVYQSVLTSNPRDVAQASRGRPATSNRTDWRHVRQ